MSGLRITRQFCSHAGQPSSAAGLVSEALVGGCLVFAGVLGKGVYNKYINAAAGRVHELETYVYTAEKKINLDLAQLTGAMGQLQEQHDKAEAKLSEVSAEVQRVQAKQRVMSAELQLVLDEQVNIANAVQQVQQNQDKVFAALQRIESAMLLK